MLLLKVMGVLACKIHARITIRAKEQLRAAFVSSYVAKGKTMGKEKIVSASRLQ